MKKDHTPEVSVFVAAQSSNQGLQACLNALRTQHFSGTAEVIVALGEGSRIPESHPWPENLHLRTLSLDGQNGIAALRAAGVHAASAPLLAMTEDHCIPAPDWLDQILQLHAAHSHAVIAGEVSNAARDSLVDRVGFLLEYLPFTDIRAEMVVQAAAAANVSYKSAALHKIWSGPSFTPEHVHARFRQQGEQILIHPALQVQHCQIFSTLDLLRERFHFSRWFAGTRFTGTAKGRRAFYAIASPLIPLLTTVRLCAQLRRKPAFRRDAVLGLPLILLYLLVWAAGEFLGYIAGPGSSGDHIG